jgi:Flp pilus assembly secretin CpaC
VSQSEQLTLNGIPGLGAIPGLNKIVASNGKMEDTDELLVVITPHLIQYKPGQSVEVWLPRSGQ